MFVVNLLVGYGLVLLYQEFGLLAPTVVWAGSDKIQYTVYQDRKTWQEARDDCANKGDSLAFLLSYEEHRALTNYIRSQNVVPKDETSGYWLDGKYSDKTNRWEWDDTGIDTTDETYFMAGWHWDQPEKRANRPYKECMEMLYREGKTDTDPLGTLAGSALWCTEKRGYICQHG